LGSDLLSGPNNSYIATLVERHTRDVMLAKVAGKDTQTVISALIKQATRVSPMIPPRAVRVGVARASSEWYAYPSDIQAIARHRDAHDELREPSVEAVGS
jgi:hypothetical protein